MAKIFYEDQVYDLSDYSVKFFDSNVEVLILAYLELKAPKNTRLKSNVNSKLLLEEPCSLLDQEYLTYTAISESVAVSNLEWAVENEVYNQGCSLIGGINVSCFTDEHFCVASQAYCCK